MNIRETSLMTSRPQTRATLYVAGNINVDLIMSTLHEWPKKGTEAMLESSSLRPGTRRNPQDQFGAILMSHYEERLEFELGIIESMGFPGYFLIVADFIKWAKEKDIPVGPAGARARALSWPMR